MGFFSSLGLSLCYPSLILDFEGSIYDDQHGSDHFPIVIDGIKPSTEDQNPKWKLNRANISLICYVNKI